MSDKVELTFLSCARNASSIERAAACVPKTTRSSLPGRRECVRWNYIPHSTPWNANYSKWYESYYSHLLDLYNIFGNGFDARYGAGKDWDDERAFHDFCQLIWHCSSKYISPYLDSQLKNEELEVKSEDGEEN